MPCRTRLLTTKGSVSPNGVLSTQFLLFGLSLYIKSGISSFTPDRNDVQIVATVLSTTVDISTKKRTTFGEKILNIQRVD